VVKAARGAAARGRVQTAVMFVVVGAATASAVLGLTLATSSDLSFTTATAKRRAPDLAVMVDASKVTGAELARTRRLRGVTGAAGPYPATTISLEGVGGPASGGPSPSTPLTVVGRASSQGPLDDLVCFTSPPGINRCGSWPARIGEIEIAAYAPVQIASNGGRLGTVGERVTIASLPGRPKLTVSGYAVSILADADAWAVPAEIAALEQAGSPAREQMLYTFGRNSSAAEINAGVASLKAALPAGAVIAIQRLANQRQLSRSQSSQKPAYVEAYALLVLVLALLITAIVVAAAVMADYRRIGVLKGIGFTPAQIVASYLCGLAAPAVAGAVVGTVVGSEWAVPLINGGPYQISVVVPAWIRLAAPVGVCALAALAGLIPALRAARLTAVEAIAAGQSPRIGGDSRVSRLVARLPLPRPATLGAGSALSRPGASLATAAVVAIGLAGAVLAVGLSSQMLQLVLGASTPLAGGVVSGRAVVHRFTILVAVVGGLGVLSAAIMLARQRVHDLGVCKAIGMTPRQLVAMICCWVLAPALAGAVIAVPAGIVIEHAVATAVIEAQTAPLSQVAIPEGRAGARLFAPPRAGRGVRPVMIHAGAESRIDLPRRGGPQPFATHPGLPGAYNPGTLALVVLAGLAIATLGALLPALWAAASNTTSALRAE
jgi:putative ABC transport system permease protein